MLQKKQNFFGQSCALSATVGGFSGAKSTIYPFQVDFDIHLTSLEMLLLFALMLAKKVGHFSLYIPLVYLAAIFQELHLNLSFWPTVIPSLFTIIHIWGHRKSTFTLCALCACCTFLWSAQQLSGSLTCYSSDSVVGLWGPGCLCNGLITGFGTVGHTPPVS